MEITNTAHYSKQDAQWIEVARELYKAMQWRKEWEAAEKKLKAQLVELSDNQNAYGGGFKFEKIERKGSVDYDLICDLHIPGYKDFNLDEYRNESSSYWKLSTASTEVIDAFKDLL